MFNDVNCSCDILRRRVKVVVNLRSYILHYVAAPVVTNGPWQRGGGFVYDFFPVQRTAVPTGQIYAKENLPKECFIASSF